MVKSITTSQLGAKVKRLAKKMGCTFENSDEGYEIFAPKGMLFAVTDSHSVIAWHRDVNIFKRKAYERLLEDLETGLYPCDDPECDVCHPEEE